MAISTHYIGLFGDTIAMTGRYYDAEGYSPSKRKPKPDPSMCRAYVNELQPVGSRFNRQEKVFSVSSTGCREWVRDKPRPPKFMDCRKSQRHPRKLKYGDRR